ncbi:MAG TPA: formate dehydrogenase accessory sulfurtransferase FdhD [Acidobacteriota bacterium]|nr:formate dehydrogenase accessory sulfurtransferase FdhD [Acidobacteriota bacterium]
MIQKGQLPEEKMVRLFLNGRFFSHLLCTPRDLKEFAVGWLFCQEYIDGPDQIDTLGVASCDGSPDISVCLSTPVPSQPSPASLVTPTGCGGGRIESSQYLRDLVPLTSPLTISAGRLPGIMSMMFRELASRGGGPGVHCAALVTGDDPSAWPMGFDVGRHNAVDKAIGAGLLHGVDFGAAILATSGRVSSDMVLKSARAGVPVVTSQRSVTTLAAEIAAAAGIAVVGRLNRPDRVVLGRVDRITP